MQKTQNRIEAFLLLLPLAAIALIWSRLPASIPVHWNLRGEIDRLGVRGSIFLLPAIAFALNGLLQILPRFDPKMRRDPDQTLATVSTLRKFRLALTFFLAVLCSLQIMASLGYASAAGRMLITATLLLLAMLGNYLGNLRPNYFVGIRTPWTLEDPDTWRATHRPSARLICFGAF
jgi:uncharacterized membrane protein